MVTTTIINNICLFVNYTHFVSLYETVYRNHTNSNDSKFPAKQDRKACEYDRCRDRRVLCSRTGALMRVLLRY